MTATKTKRAPARRPRAKTPATAAMALGAASAEVAALAKEIDRTPSWFIVLANGDNIGEFRFPEADIRRLFPTARRDEEFIVLS